MSDIPFSQCVVLCRPGQLRPAAVALSGCPSGSFTPLIVVDHPPCSEPDYRDRYAAYVTARDARDALTGTVLARHAAHPDAISAANRDVDAAASVLTDYRSWWRHQRSVAELFAEHPPICALLLFDQEPGDLDQLDAIPMSRIGDARLALLPTATHVARLRAEPLEDLAERAWQACGGIEALKPAIGIAGDGAAAWMNALASALRTGRPLRPGAPVDEALAEIPADAEAVLIEVADQAERLLGVQYAQARNAKLVLTPDPALDSIQAAVGNMQAVADGKFLGRLREFLFGDPAVGDGLAAIERAVNAVVTDDAVSAVGARDLTAFTAGVPYGFVRRAGADWSAKPIGHVSGDATLLVLTDLLGVPDAGGVGFSLIFDPGYFSTDETRLVMGELGTRPSHAIVLRDGAAAYSALQRLSAMPLDFVYFNTHGSDREILLADGRLSGWKLVQRTRLRARPVVFNSSCLSWVGVGREFVRVGARGYVGTLWSVNAGFASDFARVVLERAAGQAISFARAIRGTGVDSATERAYIYAGTASARLAADRDCPSVETRSAQLGAGVQALLDRLCESLEAETGLLSERLLDPLHVRLWDDAAAIAAAREAIAPAHDATWFSISALRLRVASRWTRRVDIRAAAHAWFAQAHDALDTAPLGEAERAGLRSELMRQAGRFYLAEGDAAAAVRILSDSLPCPGGDDAPTLVSLCDALRRCQRTADALDAAQRALAAADKSGQPERTRLAALGRLAQLKLALYDTDGALSDAREGLALAVEQDDLSERASFTGDMARALLRLGRFAEATDAAAAMRALSRQTRDDSLDLSALGLLGQASLGIGDLDGAARAIGDGIATAQALGNLREEGDFRIDLCRLRLQCGDAAGAMAAAIEAVPLFVKAGDMARVRNGLGQAATALNALAEKPDASDWLSALFRKAEFELRLLRSVSPDIQAMIAAEGAGRFVRLCDNVPVPSIAAALTKLADLAEAIREQGPGAPPAIAFLAQAYRAFAKLMAGDLAGARDPAVSADALANGHTQIAALVERRSAALP